MSKEFFSLFLSSQTGYYFDLSFDFGMFLAISYIVRRQH